MSINTAASVWHPWFPVNFSVSPGLLALGVGSIPRGRSPFLIQVPTRQDVSQIPSTVSVGASRITDVRLRGLRK